MTSCGVKFRAKPTIEQANIPSQWISCTRVIYNSKLSEDNQNYSVFKSTGEKSSVHQAYSHFKTEERDWLNQCPSHILCNASSIWDMAKQHFLNSIAKDPREKKKGIKKTELLRMNYLKSIMK